MRRLFQTRELQTTGSCIRLVAIVLSITAVGLKLIVVRLVGHSWKPKTQDNEQGREEGGEPCAASSVSISSAVGFSAFIFSPFSKSIFLCLSQLTISYPTRCTKAILLKTEFLKNKKFQLFSVFFFFLKGSALQRKKPFPSFRAS